MLETHFLLENLCISEPSLGILEKFQRSSALPNIKYNCVVLFLGKLYWLFPLCFKIYFPIGHHWYNLFDKAKFSALHTPCTRN